MVLLLVGCGGGGNNFRPEYSGTYSGDVENETGARLGPVSGTIATNNQANLTFSGLGDGFTYQALGVIEAGTFEGIVRRDTTGTPTDFQATATITVNNRGQFWVLRWDEGTAEVPSEERVNFDLTRTGDAPND